MLRILFDKILRLGRDEDGAALVVTLAVFFFMYLGCMGVYAVSTAVKDRIHLQNAVDAAAYSAAVVQADTLSRIATINRAMSWTYVQMTRHQMDYIVCKWLKHTCEHYDDDEGAAIAWAAASVSLCSNKDHKMDYHITDEKSENKERKIHLNGNHFPTRKEVGEAVNEFIRKNPLDSLEESITSEKQSVSDMNEAIATLLDQMPKKVEDAVRSVLGANLAHLGGTGAYFYLEHCANPREKYMRMLKNTVDDETKFLSFSGYGSVKKTFEKGIDVWFVRGNEKVEEGGNGIQRSYNYNHERGDKLYSRWDWHSTKWFCFWVPYKWVHIPLPKIFCSHPPHEKDECAYSVAELEKKTIKYLSYEWEEEASWTAPPSDRKKWPYDSPQPEDDAADAQRYSDYYREEVTKDANGNEITHYYVLKKVEKESYYYVPQLGSALDLTKGRVDFTATCHGDNDQIYNKDYYVGAKAEPYVLTKEYFGTNGTISVGVRRKNENVFARVLGAVDGIFTAFDPDWNGADKATYTYVFASAKAGYKNKDDSAASLEYKVSWQDGSWNLCQSDLDAVFIPVRRATSTAIGAEGGIWHGDDDKMLSVWVVNNVDAWKPVDDAVEEDKVETDMCVNISAPRGILREDQEDGKLDWEKLSRVMFH